MNKIKLQKFMSDSGINSRRKCEQLILDGLVKVNDHIAKLGERVDPINDKVTLNGKTVQIQNNKFYIMLNKPRGFLTSLSDDRGRKCVVELLKKIPARVYPIGRLDKNSEGLLLLTNDGEFANNIIHPSNNKWKTYRVTVKPVVTSNQIEDLCKSIVIDGKKTKPAKVKLIDNTAEKSILEISIQEGRNRQIRRMCEELNLEVLRLKRISIGNLVLGDLPLGKFRYLTTNEIESLITPLNA